MPTHRGARRATLQRKSPLQVPHGVHAPETESVAVSYQGCFVKARLPGRSSVSTPGAEPGGITYRASQDPLGIEPWRFLHEHPVQTLRPVRPVCEPVLEPTLGPRSCLRVQRRSPRQFCDSSEGRRNGNLGDMSISTRDTVECLADVRNDPNGVDRLDVSDVVDKSIPMAPIAASGPTPCRWRPPSRS